MAVSSDSERFPRLKEDFIPVRFAVRDRPVIEARESLRNGIETFVTIKMSPTWSDINGNIGHRVIDQMVDPR